jgi:hydrogenase maturation factor
MSIEDHYASCAADSHCVTCSDEALPATVVSVDREAGLAVVAVNGGTAEVDVTLVDAVGPGHVLLIHGGAAIAHLESA